MNYICNRDITIQFSRDQLVSDRDLYRIFQNLFDKGYLDPVPEDAYAASVHRDIFYVDDKRITELTTVADFKAAFVERNIPYDPLWRRDDFIHAAEKWIQKMNDKERRRKRK